MWMWVCSLGFVVLLWKHLHNAIKDLVGRVALSQPGGGKDPPKNNTTIIKTQLHPGSKHKQHTKCNKFRTSRRLHH